MAYKQKKSIPKREDDIYTEIENFEDFELINNVFYEMAIRTKEFKELEQKYKYCEKLSKQINKFIKWEEPLKNINFQYFTNTEGDTYTSKKSAKDNFEEALKELEEDPLKIFDRQLFKLLELDFEMFKKEIEITSLENMENEEVIAHYNFIEKILYIIPKIIEQELFVDFIEYYYGTGNTKPQSGIEYEESSTSSLYIKREFKEKYYIETIIDKENNKISRTLYPLTKRKLLIDHIIKFSSNHLIIQKQAIKFLEDFFEHTEIKMKKQLALANAFFCYDYYNYRLEEIHKKNKKIEEDNLNNIELQEAIERIEEINNDTYLTDQQKSKERAPYVEIKKYEEVKLLEKPALHKTSNHYVFKETNFKNSNINHSTALKYYQWLKPYIDELKYIDIINSEQLI